MSVELTYRCVCDNCGAAGPVSLMSTGDSVKLAKKKKWFSLELHKCGACVHYCPPCYDEVQVCKVCEKRTYDPKSDLCGACGWVAKE